jgi:carbamate kinase
MRVVVALGGNALLRRGERADVDVQRRNVTLAAAALARLEAEHEVIVTHGNGPQVGLLAAQSESLREVPPYPLDVLDAETEGMIGHLLEIALRNSLEGREVVTLLTEVLVDPADPAFARPSKPVGQVYDEAEASRLATARGWTMARDGAAFRRVVASPEPRGIVPVWAIRTLVDAGAVVICAGGGGIPVATDSAELRGVEGVIDKDLTASLLAAELGADLLMMLTDVEAVEVGRGTPEARPLRRVTPAELRRHEFEPGSMGPKVEAACRFVESTGGRAAIGALGEAFAIASSDAGTQVVADAGEPGDRPLSFAS